MYNESSEKIFSIRSFILKVILVILFVFLLMWLFPMPNLKPVYDRIFADNIDTMKDAAKSYFTVERLPKEVNKSVRMTLDEMLSMKLLLPLADSDNKLCDGRNSYVEIMKTDTEYLIKINLSCPNKSDYIVEHLGCYDICADKCQPTEEEVLKPTTNKPTQPKPPVKPPKDPDKPPVEKPPVEKPPVNPPETKYLYTYQRNTTYYSGDSWSNWSADIRYVDADNIAFGCTADKCTEVSPGSPKFEKVGTKTIYKTDSSGNKIPIYNSKESVIYTYTTQACAGYDYVIYNNTEAVAYKAGSDWTYVGTYKYTDRPSDSATVRYEYAGAGFADNCSGTCTADYILLRKYTKLAAASASSTSVSSINITCSSKESTTVNVTAMRKEFVGYVVDKTIDVYAYVKYYHYQTRTSTGSYYTSTDTQTRNAPDQNLINSGYTLIKKEAIK
jgi:hypothetical protein